MKKTPCPYSGYWYPDEAFIAINGERLYLWRAVDQDGNVLDILARKHRNRRAAKRFFRKLLKGHYRLFRDKAFYIWSELTCCRQSA